MSQGAAGRRTAPQPWCVLSIARSQGEGAIAPPCVGRVKTTSLLAAILPAAVSLEESSFMLQIIHHSPKIKFWYSLLCENLPNIISAAQRRQDDAWKGARAFPPQPGRDLDVTLRDPLGVLYDPYVVT